MTDDASLIADAKRWHALRALPRDMNNKLHRMCVQAIGELAGDQVSGDPMVLLDLDERDFYGLADRAGIDTKYKYRLYKTLMEGGVVRASAAESQDLYRHFDAGERLLYVGVSGRLALREKAHKRSPWHELVAYSTTEAITGRAAVLEAEKVAIETELPLFNILHNDTPEARERLRVYLEGIGRMELMRAAA